MAVKLGNGNWAVKEDKLLAYNDNSGLFFNKEFDFSRGTSATYVAKDGLIKTAGIQPNIVNNGDFSELGSELVTNGDFDTDSDWNLARAVIENGVGKFQESVGTYSRIRQDINFTGQVKVTYTISFNNSSKTTIQLRSYGGGDNEPISAVVGTHTVYRNFTSDGISFQVGGLASDEEIHLDNVSVKQVDPNDYWTLGTGWSIEDGKLVSNGVESNASQSGVVQNGNTYKITLTTNNVTTGYLSVRVGSGGTENFQVNSNGTQTFNTTADNGTFLLFRNQSGFDGSIDDVTVQEIQTDTPRIDFTNDTKGHLLLEPQSTNLLQRSNQFDNSYWDKFNVTVTANSAISPDGTNNAFLLDVGTANDDHSLRKEALAPTSTYTVSIFAKKGSTDYAWFLCGASSRGVQAIFDLSDGSVTDSATVGSGQTLVAAKSVDMGNGWYRLIMEAETTAPPQNNLTITPYYQDTFSGNIDTAWQGNNETIYIYGAMNEESSFATSYIPTTNATSTRNADVCNNSGSAQDFNSEEGVLYAELASLAEDVGNKQLAISDGTNANVVKFAFQTTANRIQLNVKSNGTTTATLTKDISSPVTNFFKMALKYKVNDCALWVNGTEVATDTSAAMPLALNTLRFDRGDGANDFIGKVRNVQVFTEALTDEQLEKLTS